MLKRKILAVFLCLVMMVVFVTGCGGGGQSSEPEEPAETPSTPEPAAKIGEGRTLVVGIWGGPQEDLVREYVIKPFEEETGATVELVLGGSSDRFARLYAEKDNPTMDIVYLGMGQTIQAAKDGLILPPNPDGVPEYNNLYEQAKAAGAYGVSIMAIGIMYNTETVDTAPTSWKDLWKPEYKGKVAPFVFPGTQGTGFLVMAARVHGGDESNIDPGFEALKQLKPYPAILSGIDETNLAFQQGDVWFTPQIHGYVYEYKDQGGKVDFVMPEEGAPLAMNSAAIVKGSKNVDLAEIFINYHLSQAAQEAYARELFYAPTNKTVVLDDELAAKMPYGEEQVSKLTVLDDETISANQADWAERWNREILN
ncbi:MAG: ABC transporter substrate-binding protein [Zhaonellaceae bacterium]|jgi:putative spermidine/putrescine transport system substrate-binding protein|nr:ABC transporter substrate-binding protein [Clostridia bacterium]